MGIALVADRNTATCFKLAGLSNVHSVEDAKGAAKCLQKLLEKGNLKVVLVSERLLNQVQILDEIAAHKYPLIIPIPDIKGSSALKSDLMIELIKRKTGIEVKF